MSLCINPKCPRPDHPGNDHSRYCVRCGSDLLLNDRYRVLRLLSDKTGFGKIYEAYEHTTPKILKVLKESWNTNSKVVELFEQEARVLGKLDHPGIPKVDDYFQHSVSSQGWTTPPLVHCIVMEKVDGLNLDEWMVQQGNHPIAQTQALRWLKQVVEVLGVVHANHYFHRDIKPGNIMLHRSGQLVLIDFGTARDLTYSYASKLQGHRITAVVSPGFTPHEQSNGQAVPQSDFFALGRSFVQLLTGNHPSEMYDPQEDELHWRDHTTNVSPLLLDLLDRMMARKVGDRPVDTRAILQQITEIEKSLQPQPIKSPTAPPRKSIVPAVKSSTLLPRKSYLPAVVAISGLVILGGAIGYWLKLNPNPIAISSPSDTPISAPNASEQTSPTPSFPMPSDYANLALANTLSGHSRPVNSVAISADGQTIVSGSEDSTIKVWNLKTGELLQTLSAHSDTVFS
ncbi:MAG: protein kinase, partial [Cyanobacteria bacterium RU_5_0]|nr:protein kinase [Cyanobacteria bacterium RU_5_0]